MGTTPGKTPSVSLPPEAVALLEREAELALVEQVLAATSRGQGSLLLVQGPAGIGKSRLLEAARRQAGGLGFQVLHARAGEMEREFPHGVVRQLYEPLLASRDEEARTGLFAGAAHLARSLLAHGGPQGASAGQDASATLHGLYWLTVNLAERAPALLVVDDLHWCDGASLRFISYLTRRLDGLRASVVASARSGEPAAQAGVLAELEWEPLARALRPAPLSVAAVDQLLRAALGRDVAPEFLEAVNTACGGNPLLLRELGRAIALEGIEPDAMGAQRVRELGPDSLARFVLRRLHGLGEAAEALARAVAVLGDGADLTVAAALAELDADAAAGAATALGRAEILRAREPLGFVHPVLRSAVYAALGDPERRRAHDRAAEVLHGRGAPAQQVAAHLVHAPPRGRASAVAVLREAARRASAEGAADAAGAFLARALVEPPEAEEEAEVLLDLGIAELRAGLGGATDHLRAAHSRLSGRPRLAESALSLASALYARGALDEATAVLLRTIERLDPSDADLAQRLDAELIMWARLDARLYPMARERLQRRGVPAVADGFGGRLLQALAASDLARAGEAPEEARALTERALAGGLLLGDESSHAYATAVAVLLSLDDLDEAVRRYTDWLELARRRGSVFGFTSASWFRSLAMMRRGDLAEAEADARTALDAIQPLAGGAGYPEFRAYLAEMLAERGELAAALEALDAAEGTDEGSASYGMARRLEVRARLRVAAGDDARGLAELLEAGERLTALGVFNPSHSAWRSKAALLLQGSGDGRAALELVGEEVERARRWRAPRPLGAALRAAGLIEGGADGLELLRESVEVLSSSPALLERARSLTELGAALRRGNRRAEAREPLAEGLELAGRCGAAPLVEQAHAELLATGARPRRLVRTGLDSLTPSERRVARMAAGGATNREIAEALFVTPKTVEMHLSHAYRKLDIQGRSQLASVMDGR